VRENTTTGNIKLDNTSIQAITTNNSKSDQETAAFAVCYAKKFHILEARERKAQITFGLLILAFILCWTLWKSGRSHRLCLHWKFKFQDFYFYLVSYLVRSTQESIRSFMPWGLTTSIGALNLLLEEFGTSWEFGDCIIVMYFNWKKKVWEVPSVILSIFNASPKLVENIYSIWFDFESVIKHAFCWLKYHSNISVCFYYLVLFR